jgi:uncharacterized phage-like protein YoqJ
LGKVIGGTGHRPDKLYGYDMSNPKYRTMIDWVKKELVSEDCDEAICGMALGFDQIFGLAVIELKDEGYDIKLHCAIPCLNYTKKWYKQSDINRYNFILSRADVIKIVHEDEYKPWYLDDRNKYVVDLSDKMLAAWNGSKGGTYNCVKYAMKNNKPIIQMVF